MTTDPDEKKHRFQRLMRLLDEIKNRPGQTAQQLADLLGKSKRNVFRDIRLLIQSGFEISTAGGYRLANEHASQPLPDQALHLWEVRGAGPVEVELRVEPRVARVLQDAPLHTSQNIKGEKLTLTVTGPDRVIDWTLATEGVELIKPTWLRRALARRAQQLVELYS